MFASELISALKIFKQDQISNYTLPVTLLLP